MILVLVQFVYVYESGGERVLVAAVSCCLETMQEVYFNLLNSFSFDLTVANSAS